MGGSLSLCLHVIRLWHAHHEGETCVQIAFPPGETDDTRLWIVWFLAVVNGHRVHCGISYHALRTHFSADWEHPFPAFVTHRHRIEQLFTAFMQQHCIEDEMTIVMRAHDIEEQDGGW